MQKQTYKQYRNEEELRRFGSDYNKYLNNLSKEMTVINIDGLQYKRSEGILRIVESKHTNEVMKWPQREVLYLLSSVLSYCNSIAKHFTFQVYMVTGNPPYNEISVENLLTGIETKLTGDAVRKFSELEISP